MAEVRGKLAGGHPQLLSLLMELNVAAHSALFTCLGDFLATPSVSLVQILRVRTDNWKTTAAGQETQNSTSTGKINTERTQACKAEQHLSPQTKANTFYSLNLLVFQQLRNSQKYLGKRECAGVTFFVNSCKGDVHPSTLWWWCQALLTQKGTPSPS